MKPFFCIVLFSVFLSVFHGSQEKDLIHDVCTQATKDDKNLKYDFCKRTLHAIPAHERPNMEHLCLASIGLLSRNIWETKQEIAQKLQDHKKSDVHIEKIMDKCHEYYDDAVSLSNDALESFGHKKYTEANVKITDALAKANACSDAFEDRRLVSPLQRRYKDLRKYYEITLDIIAMID